MNWETPKVWKAQITGAYVLGGLSVVGILGGRINHSALEVHSAFVTLMVAIGWMVFIRFMIWWRRR